MRPLSAELIAIVATGATLAGLLVVGQHCLEDRLISGQHRLEDRLLAVETEQVRVNVLLEEFGFTAWLQDSGPARE